MIKPLSNQPEQRLPIDKATVAKNFARAAASYEDHAELQRHAALRLSELIGQHLSSKIKRIVDVGCGTGLLTRQLLQRFPNSQFIATDIAAPMLDQSKNNLSEHLGRVSFEIADAESLNLNAPVDLIGSGLTVQWLDLKTCLEQWWPQTNALAFSTLVDDTLGAWTKIVRQHSPNSESKVVGFLSSHDVRRQCQGLSPSRFEFHVETFQQEFPSVVHFLKSLKRVGAHASADNQIDASTLRRCIQAVNHDSANSTFMAEYRIAYCLLIGNEAI